MRLLPVLAAGCFVSSMAMRLVDPVVPGIARDLSVSAGSAALLATAYTLPYALGQPLLGALGDAVGKAKIIKLALVVLAICMAGAVVAPSFDALFVIRVIGGAAGGGIIPLAFAMVGDRFAFDERQVALSRVLTAIIGGQVTGSLGSGLIGEQFGWRASMVMGTVLTIVALIITLVYLKPRADAERPTFSMGRMRAGYAEVFRNPKSAICFAAVFVEGIAIFGLLPYVAMLLEQRGAGGLKEAGFVLSGFAIGGILYTIMVKVLLGHLGQYNLIRVGGIVCGIGLAALSFNVSWPTELAIFIVVGAGFYMIHNSLQTQATELAPGNRGSALATHAFFFFTGQAVGPILYRVGLTGAGVTATLMLAGALMALNGLVTAAALHARDADRDLRVP